MTRNGWLAAAMMVGLAVPAWPQNVDDGDDPNHGVARIGLLNGEVSVRRGDTGEVVAADLNAPLVALDHVLTGPGSRAEIQFDWANMIRLGAVSEVRVGELRDGDYLIQVAEGTTTLRVLRDTNARVEISTPTVSVRPVEKGIYRITVRPDGATEVTVRSGRADIFTPRGTEVLRSGRTLEARGTAADPEYMIVAANGKDDWDRWNENRDRDLERSRSYQYVSRDIYGADDLDAHGRWVYDSPYGWVWVPNVTTTWAPYRVGRWSWVNYYGWTWISSDPWGWAPYHYGRWYSSSYGWAWYPGAVSTRYYWRPALVGFFGWGSSSVQVGVGWGWGNVGWVPLAPYEVYRPWYGRNTTVRNNITIINNTNITNVYRNARQFGGRDAVTSVNANGFGRGRTTTDNYVRVTNADLSRAGHVQGQMPLEATRESRRYVDRAPTAEVETRANSGRSRQFATAPVTATAPAPTNVDRTRRGGEPVATAPVTTTRGNVDRTARGTEAPSSGGWRRFDPSASVSTSERSGVERGNRNSAVEAPRRQATEVPQTVEPQSNRRGSVDRSREVQVAPPVRERRYEESPRENVPSVQPSRRVERSEAPRVEAPRRAERVEAPRAEAPRVEAPRVEAPRGERGGAERGGSPSVESSGGGDRGRRR